MCNFSKLIINLRIQGRCLNGLFGTQNAILGHQDNLNSQNWPVQDHVVSKWQSHHLKSGSTSCIFWLSSAILFWLPFQYLFYSPCNILPWFGIIYPCLILIICLSSASPGEAWGRRSRGEVNKCIGFKLLLIIDNLWERVAGKGEVYRLLPFLWCCLALRRLSL